MLSLVQAPDLFAPVESGVYRSTAVVEPHSIPFLLTLSLRTVLLLTPELPSRPLISLIDETGIRLNHIGNRPASSVSANSRSIESQSQSMSSWKHLSDEIVKEGIEFVMNASNHPCLVMCSSGIHETGAFIGCLRKLLGWNFNSIVVEYRCFAGSKSRYLIQQFIELFDTDLITLPQNSQTLPFWYKEYLRTLDEDENEREQNVIIV
ncbi:hypothetical protein HDU81_008567 [Chytriomyces hyalinus]|nr:hypothetical protein HDU81_008567 [Chytriomyces hyalinus]